ncbi:MAG: DUF4230 domain-containing protein [Gemmatimonadota bacterium]|nr:DUF4230 domain-containing protein [Gemmatimonadota bacterium]
MALPGTTLSRGIGRLLFPAGLLILLGLGFGIAQRALSPGWLRNPEPRVTHDVVVEQLRDVAKLVSTEMTLRDVVVFQHTRFGSTKRALLVVTGKVLAGINLQKGTDVKIDHAARKITIVLPPAEILAVDVVNVRTYDERAGLLNPFTTEDRDAMQRRVRMTLVGAGQQSGLLGHADRSARQMLQELFSRDGYTVEVTTPVRLEAPRG